MPFDRFNNDFIILKLSSALTFNPNVGPACLPESDYSPETTNEICFVSGWGVTQHGATGTFNEMGCFLVWTTPFWLYFIFEYPTKEGGW